MTHVSGENFVEFAKILKEIREFKLVSFSDFDNSNVHKKLPMCQKQIILNRIIKFKDQKRQEKKIRAS